MAYSVGKFIPSDMAKVRGKHAALGTFSFALESEKCRCQRRKAVN